MVYDEELITTSYRTDQIADALRPLFLFIFQHDAQAAGHSNR